MRKEAVIIALALAVACGRDGGVAPPPVIARLRLSLAASEIEVGQMTQATARRVDESGAPITTGPVTFVSSRPEVAAISPTTGQVLAIAAGTTEITVSGDGISAEQRLAVFTSPIRINEIDPDGDQLGGWVELYNPTAAPVDLSDWQLAGADLFATLRLPAGTAIPANGYFVIDESRIPLGLGPSSGVRAFSRFGVSVDAYAWSSDPLTTWGRCPEGTGEFVATAGPSRGTANRCAPEESASTVTDPSGDTFGGAFSWDLTAMSVTRDASAVTVQLTFSSTVISPIGGAPIGMIGFVDFDTDQDPTTGGVSTVDEFRPDQERTGIGKDFDIDLSAYEADSTVSVRDASGTATGRVRPVFDGPQVTIRIPLTMLGSDDGYLNAAAIVGTAARPSDIIPERGHLELSRPGASVSARQTPLRVGSPADRASPGGTTWR